MTPDGAAALPLPLCGSGSFDGQTTPMLPLIIMDELIFEVDWRVAEVGSQLPRTG
jgi:hypothetical protein